MIASEQLSHELALRFASKCYSHLEVTHFKDNFKSLADHQDDVGEYNPYPLVHLEMLHGGCHH